METLLQFYTDATQGFWVFVGYLMLTGIVLGLPLQFMIVIFNRFFRHWNIRKHGYPPAHCDADGDFKKTDD